MIKKILITLFVFIVFFQLSYAEDDCPIKNGPSIDIQEYLSNNRKIISNITKETLTANKEKKEKVNLKYEYGVLFNNIIDWNGYDNYLKYYITFPLSNNVIYQIKRDYKILENEGESLNKYLKSIIENGYEEIEIKNPCNGIDKKFDCKLGGNSLKIIEELIKNQSNIISNYRVAVIGEDNFKEVKLVNKDFNKNIVKDYGKGNSCKGDFSFLIDEKIFEIENNFKNGVKGFKELEEAWKLLEGNLLKTDIKTEKDLLIKELKKQGISGSKADAMLNNLEKYNQTGFTGLRKNNFITESAEYFINSSNNQFEAFNIDVFENFTEILNNGINEIKKFTKETYEQITKKNEKNNMSMGEFEKNKNIIDIDSEIAESVRGVYSKEIPFIAVGDSQTTQIRADFVNLHNNLSESIKILQETCETAVRVCNSQDKGVGYCGSCN